MQTVPDEHALVSLDVSDPARPREVGRAVFDAAFKPHWLAFDAGGSRLVVNDGTARVFLVALDPRTGGLAIDAAFRDSAATVPGVSFAREGWPHGSTGAAVSHGSVFANRALYESMLKTLKETTTTDNIPAINIRIVHGATVPAPVNPNRNPSLLMAALYGLALGMAAAVGLESLDTTLKAPEDLEGCLELPNLAMIPHLDIAAAPDNPAEIPGLVMLDRSRPLAAEAYRVLRTSIHFSTPGHPPRTLLITSAQPQDGKTLTAANLAAAVAQAGGAAARTATRRRSRWGRRTRR